MSIIIRKRSCGFPADLPIQDGLPDCMECFENCWIPDASAPGYYICNGCGKVRMLMPSEETKFVPEYGHSDFYSKGDNVNTPTIGPNPNPDPENHGGNACWGGCWSAVFVLAILAIIMLLMFILKGGV